MTHAAPRLFARLVWHGRVILAVVAAMGIPLLIAYSFVRRFVFADAAFIEETPIVGWLGTVAFLVVTWWFTLVPYCRRSIRVWRGRNDREAVAYLKAVGDIENSGSPTGNIIAKIMLIPFLLIGVGVIIWMVVGFFS